jgi:hypothetical protein
MQNHSGEEIIKLYVCMNPELSTSRQNSHNMRNKKLFLGNSHKADMFQGECYTH